MKDKRIIWILLTVALLCGLVITAEAQPIPTVRDKYDPLADLVSISDIDTSISLTPVEGELGPIDKELKHTKDGNAIMFQNFFGPQVSLRYTAIDYMLKEEIIIEKSLSARATDLILPFKVNLLGLTYRYEYDDLLLYDSNGTKKYVILHPVMIDANGLHTELKYSFDGSDYIVTVPQKILHNATYPIIIDPTIQYGGFSSWDENYWNYSTGNAVGYKGVTDGRVWTYSTKATSGEGSANTSTKQLYAEAQKKIVFSGNITIHNSDVSGIGDMMLYLKGSLAERLFFKQTYGAAKAGNITQLTIENIPGTTRFNISNITNVINSSFNFAELGNNVNLIVSFNWTAQKNVVGIVNFTGLAVTNQIRDDNQGAIYNGLVLQNNFDNLNLIGGSDGRYNDSAKFAQDIDVNTALINNISSPNGGAIKILGTNSTNISNGNILNFDKNIDYSIEMYVNASNRAGSQILAAKGDTALWGWVLYIISGTSTVGLYQHESGVCSGYTTFTNSITGNYSHVVVTVKRNNETCLYVDGVKNSCKKQTISCSDGLEPNITTTNKYFTVGWNPADISPLNGSVDYIKIFNRSLSASEIFLRSKFLQNFTPAYFNVTIYNEGTMLSINASGNITATSQRHQKTATYLNQSQVILFGLLNDTYSVTVFADGYSPRTYIRQIGAPGEQKLSAYLTASTTRTNFIISNIDTGRIIYNATVKLYKIVGEDFVEMQSVVSDITGRARLYYTPATPYSIVVSHPSFNTANLSFNELTETETTISLTPTTSDNGLRPDSSIITLISPRAFYNNATNNITFTIIGAHNNLNAYGLNITYWNGSAYVVNFSTGNNGVGGSMTVQARIRSASINQKVNLTYWYYILGQNATYRHETFFVLGAASSGTLANFGKNDYGLGDAEKIIIAVMISLVLCGFAYIALGKTSVVYIGGLSLFAFSYLGFVPLWTVIVPIVVGFILVMRDD